MARSRATLALALLVAGPAYAGCGDDDTGSAMVSPAPFGAPYDTLAEWNLFADTATQTPNARVVRVDVIAPLFTDYAAKHRFLWLPEGEQVGYTDAGTWDLPVGAIVVKTFAYPRDARAPASEQRLMETRLLVREADAWQPYTYVYAPDDPDPRKATRKEVGAILTADWIDAAGDAQSHLYVVPNENECHACHGEGAATSLLGIKSIQLDRDGRYTDGGPMNQLDRVGDVFGFDAPPPPAAQRQALVDPFGTADLSLRARSYLDANCAHCHSPGGSQGQRIFHLDWASTDPVTGNPAAQGLCAIPTSAGGATCGLTYDVVPGEPEASILICRMDSAEPAVQMPPVGRVRIHDEGVALLEAWIAAMPATGCDTTTQ